jgi:menaquinone-dependent protoporphyrinogen IX oxidase
MKILILYSSKTGSTKQYAEWLSEEFQDSEIFNMEEKSKIDFANFDLAIIASPTYSGEVYRKDLILENWNNLKNAKICLLLVGAIPQDEEWSQRTYNTLPQYVKDNLALYMKIPGISMDSEKHKMSKIEELMLKHILRVDPSQVSTKKEVHKDDLIPFIYKLKEQFKFED